MDPLHHTVETGLMRDSSHESLLRQKIQRLEADIRHLRLALRTVLPHAPVDARRYAEKALEDTR